MLRLFSLARQAIAGVRSASTEVKLTHAALSKVLRKINAQLIIEEEIDNSTTGGYLVPVSQSNSEGMVVKYSGSLRYGRIEDVKFESPSHEVVTLVGRAIEDMGHIIECPGASS